MLEALSDEDQTKLAKCLEEILDIVGESMPEIQGNLLILVWALIHFFKGPQSTNLFLANLRHIVLIFPVKETIIRCNFDTELSLNTLLNNPIGAYHDW